MVGWLIEGDGTYVYCICVGFGSIALQGMACMAYIPNIMVIGLLQRHGNFFVSSLSSIKYMLQIYYDCAIYILCLILPRALSSLLPKMCRGGPSSSVSIYPHIYTKPELGTVYARHSRSTSSQ